MILFTSSWDDGSVYDMRLAELLIKYNHHATFYVPINNIEKRKVINSLEIKNLSDNFEIGAHTINHVYLNSISVEEAKKEIVQSKIELESITGNPVYGFCFPGGKFQQIHLRMVYQAGYSYARTVKMFYTVNKSNLLNTTLQLYDHSLFTYYKHLIKRGNIDGLLKYSTTILYNNKHWDSLLIEIMGKLIKDDSVDKNTIIHLWGHSWEIEKYNYWLRLENFLKVINNHKIVTKTNFEITNSILSL